MTDNTVDSSGSGDDGWPETPAELFYLPDAVLELFAKVQQGDRVDLLAALLDCVDWAEMFGGVGNRSLLPEQLSEVRRYYLRKFADVERFYLAELLSSQLMTALLATGDFVFSDALKRLGNEQPELWREIRTFFSRKEVATSQLMLADDGAIRRNG